MRRLVRMSCLAASIAGIGFFAMSVLLLGVWPGQVLEEQIRQTSPAHPLPLSASEQHGRSVYAREGCAYCHTQQIRYLDRDVARFGKATLAWETIFDYPHLWGTRRIGPDLSREASLHPADWQYAHLYAPRNLVRDSVMPSYPWLFNGAPDQPTQEATDLVAYLETLGRARALAGPEGEAKGRKDCNCSDDERKFAFGPGPLNASAAVAIRKGPWPVLPVSKDLEHGKELYKQNCSGCHGEGGAGNGPGASSLVPKPTNFTEHEYTQVRLSEALWKGVAGTSMPAWRDTPQADRAALAAVVRSFHVAVPESAAPQDILDAGAKIYSEHCAQCHGEKGAGDGSAADQFPVAPTNFQTRRPSLAASLRALRNGIEGTSMAPWGGKLTDAELSAVAAWVRTFYRGDQ